MCIQRIARFIIHNTPVLHRSGDIPYKSGGFWPMYKPFTKWVPHPQVDLPDWGSHEIGCHSLLSAAMACYGSTLGVTRHMEVSWNRGTPKFPKSSIFKGFSFINHPFGVPPFMETPDITNCIIVDPSFFVSQSEKWTLAASMGHVFSSVL